jgi:hypothetical protein
VGNDASGDFTRSDGDRMGDRPCAGIEFSRIQLAPHARRRGVLKTESEWMPDCRYRTNDEVARSGRTGETTAYIENQNMLTRERAMDCIMHSLLGEDTIY